MQEPTALFRVITNRIKTFLIMKSGTQPCTNMGILTMEKNNHIL